MYHLANLSCKSSYTNTILVVLEMNDRKVASVFLVFGLLYPLSMEAILVPQKLIKVKRTLKLLNLVS